MARGQKGDAPALQALAPVGIGRSGAGAICLTVALGQHSGGGHNDSPLRLADAALSKRTYMFLPPSFMSSRLPLLLFSLPHGLPPLSLVPAPYARFTSLCLQLLTDAFVTVLPSPAMNGGTTQPGRNPLPRPSSSHSLPEYQRNGPNYLSPYSHRRPRAPRSSPLAISSVSYDQVDGKPKDDEGSQKPRYRPNRISSTPDITVPTPSFYDSDATLISSASSPRLSSIFGATAGPPIPESSHSSSSSEDEKENPEDGILLSLAKRLSILSTSSFSTSEKDERTKKQRSSFLLHSSSTTSLASTTSTIRTDKTSHTSHTAPPMPPVPQWALNAAREEGGAANRNVKYGHRRGTSDAYTGSSTLPNQPIPRVGRLSTPVQPRPASVSRDPVESWMAMSDTAPRFSRLGLEAQGIVLPVKKRDSVASLAKVQSVGSIRTAGDMAMVSKPAPPRGDSGVTSKPEPSPQMGSANDSGAVNIHPNPKEKESPRKRGSLASLKARVSMIGVPSPSVGSENVPPLPSATSESDSPSSSVTTSNDLQIPLPPPQMPVPPPLIGSPDLSRPSATLRRDSFLAAIGKTQLAPPSPKNAPTEFGGTTHDVKSQETRASKRKSIKQIVMRITTTPMSSGNKLKVTTVHGAQSTPVVILPPDTPTSCDLPPSTRFGKPAFSSVPNLPSTKEVSEFGCRQGAARGNKKRFKTFRKRWNSIFGTVRG